MSNASTPTGDPQPGPREWVMVKAKISQDPWECFTHEKYAEQQLAAAIEDGTVLGPREDWEIFRVRLVESQGAPSPAPAGDLRLWAEMVSDSRCHQGKGGKGWQIDGEEAVLVRSDYLRVLLDKVLAATAIQGTVQAPAAPRDYKMSPWVDSRITERDGKPGCPTCDGYGWITIQGDAYRCAKCPQAPAAGPLSSRLRPDIECAPWVIEAVKKLEVALAGAPSAGRPMTWTREAVNALEGVLDWIDENQGKVLGLCANPEDLKKSVELAWGLVRALSPYDGAAVGEAASAEPSLDQPSINQPSSKKETVGEAKADPAQADGWFHCEICGEAGEDVSERDFPGLDGETYQLYAHPGCGKPPKISLDLDPAQPTEEK